MNNIFTKLPDNIINNHIMPYVYKFQDKNLLLDIHSFKKDYDLVYSIYSCEPIRSSKYSNMLFLNDLQKFIIAIDNNSILNSILMNTYIYSPFFQRNFQLENHSIIDIIRWQKRFYESKLNITSKIRIIWGLLTPTERTKFFNKYILEDDS